MVSQAHRLQHCQIRTADKPRCPGSDITTNRRAWHRNPLKSRLTAQPVGHEEPLRLPGLLALAT